MTTYVIILVSKIRIFNHLFLSFLIIFGKLLKVMNNVFLQLGSNISDRILFLKNAIKIIENEIGDVLTKSKIYESAPWGVKKQNNFLNQIIEITTKLNENILLDKILEIEKRLGRIRIKKWGERCIDIDILFYNNTIIETKNLSIPHKLIHKRMFVLLPLSEIAPKMVHPKYNKTIEELMYECKDCKLVNEYEIEDTRRKGMIKSFK